MMSDMFYVVPLGNPGEKYAQTRHNVGWLATDYIASKHTWPSLVVDKKQSGRVTQTTVAGQLVAVLYPDTFMNNSGTAVAKLVPTNEVAQLIVLHDDIDVPFGQIKVSVGRGGGGNNGVSSIIQKLGSKNFVRIRIGIAPTSFWTGKVKRPSGGGPLERFVLKPFTPNEQKQLTDTYDKVDQALTTIITSGVEAAMNQCN